MNLTNARTKGSSSPDDGRTSSSSNDSATIHIGLAGLRAGYSLIGASGYGFNASLRMLETINQSEYGEMKLQILIAEINFQMALGQYVIPYIGLNTSKGTGSRIWNSFQPAMGAQVGIGVRVHRALAVNTGYTLMTQIVRIKISSFSSDGSTQLE